MDVVNSVVRVGSDSGLAYVFQLYLGKLAENPHYTVKHVSSSLEFDLDAFVTALTTAGVDQSAAGRVQSVRVFGMGELAKEIDSGDFSCLVIEDLPDLFNHNYFSNPSAACAEVVELFRKLRRMAQIEQKSVILVDRRPGRLYESEYIGKYIETLYDDSVG